MKKEKDVPGWAKKWGETFKDVDSEMEERREMGNKKDMYTVIMKEFKNLRAASIDKSASKESDVFDLEYKDIFNFKLNDKISLLVAPVKRLTVDSVQIGYYRHPKGDVYKCELAKGKVVPGHETHQGQLIPYVEKPYTDPKTEKKWFPGIREKGEGIFITFNPDAVEGGTPKGFGGQDETYRHAYSYWQDKFEEKYRSWKDDEDGERMDYVKYHPLYVWWHSFAHRILDSLSIDSGYSSPSLRERVFFNYETEEGGCLIYAHTPGSDGTLGGLTALANNSDFGKVCSNAKRKVKQCSNGPLCDNESDEDGNVRPSACYSCMHLSDTSCEHLNKFGLDRRLLRNW